MIAIKGMKMPKNCANCLFSIYDENLGGYVCEHVGEIINKNEILKKRLDDCPLVEIVICKNCKNYVKGALDEEICLKGHELIHEDFYCADGERRK